MRMKERCLYFLTVRNSIVWKTCSTSTQPFGGTIPCSKSRAKFRKYLNRLEYYKLSTFHTEKMRMGKSGANSLEINLLFLLTLEKESILEIALIYIYSIFQYTAYIQQRFWLFTLLSTDWDKSQGLYSSQLQNSQLSCN